MPEITQPTMSDVLAARRSISPYIHRTPLRHYPSLSEMLGADVWVKHENFQILGSFKPRGGLNLVSRTPEETRRRGFVSASTGNHGQSVAFAARTFGSSATIYVPEGANDLKIKSMRALGATVIEHGAIFEDSRKMAEAVAKEEGLRYVHPANEADLVAGVGTYSLEIHEDLSDIDFIIVPVGAGSGASGACIVSDAVAPATKVIGAQAAAAPAAQLSWQKGELVDAPMRTIAEGLATGSAYELPIRILRKSLADFVLVGEDRILEGIRLYIESTRTLVEHAGAVALSAALDIKDRLRGKRVVLVASGANITLSQLRTALSAG